MIFKLIGNYTNLFSMFTFLKLLIQIGGRIHEASLHRFLQGREGGILEIRSIECSIALAIWNKKYISQVSELLVTYQTTYSKKVLDIHCLNARLTVNRIKLWQDVSALLYIKASYMDSLLFIWTRLHSPSK